MHKLKSALEGIGLDPDALMPLVMAGDETVHCIPSTGAAVEQHWRQMRELVAETGYWPVIIGSFKQLELLRELFVLASQARSAAQIIAAVDSVAVLAILNSADELANSEYAPHGAWPDDAAHQTSVAATLDISTGKPLARAYLGFAPTTISWQVPAFLRFAAPNYQLASQDHCAVLRHWQELYGAETIVVTADTIELLVAKPPQDRDAAIEVALAQLGYAPDLVEPEDGFVDELAASLLGSTYWFFWWH